MAKFNSLGSNFNLREAWRALWLTASEGEEERGRAIVRRYLGIEASEEVAVEFYYKGREALRAGLASLGLPKGSKVGVVGFTCVAVVEAIEREGLETVLLEVDENLNLDLEKLTAELASQLRVLIVQNTFGYPQVGIEKLKQFCREYKIVLVEDAAHCLGAVYENGQKVGQVGEIVVFSASQDKILDAVSGGVLVCRGKWRLKKAEREVSARQQKKDRQYLWWTFWIRQTYRWGLGKILHRFLKEREKLSRPMIYEGAGEISRLPGWQVRWLREQLEQLEAAVGRRRENCEEYLCRLPKEKLYWDEEGARRGAGLRLPVRVKPERRGKILKQLARAGFYLEDVWYEVPVGPAKYWSMLEQKEKITAQFGRLSGSERVAGEIINLPLHQGMRVKEIAKICQIVSDGDRV